MTPTGPPDRVVEPDGNEEAELMEAGDVVVGVDGSGPSREALRWAAEEARRSGGQVHVVVAYADQAGAGAPPPTAGVPHLTHAQAAAVVDEAVAEVRTAAPGTGAVGTAVPGAAAAALLNAAEKARLVVVGHRGQGGFASLPLGSVSLRIATHAPCPVAVVRGEARPADPVVMAVNGSRSATLVIPEGFAQAAARGCGLVAARVFPRTTARYDREERRAELVGSVAPWRRHYPQVAVEYVLLEGSPTGYLTHLSYRAQLIVLGSRGSHGFTGLLLGSTTQHLIHNSGCPVLIARARHHG
ncbi:MAG TPA: universal stress protein [Micromonosporaceae bacterium]|nr:universal stress protein [Micromonosporaceae bacterium]